jgi:septal ring factor EnvC (AmiA/AmiB activator)
MSSDLLNHFDAQIQNQEQLLREREQELDHLRRQRERLAELQQQRDELRTQLRAVESDIALVERSMTAAIYRFNGRSEAPAVRPAPPVPASAARVTVPPGPKATTLKDEIRKALRAARGPLTGPAVAARVRAGGYKTSSADFPAIVKKHLGEMDDVTHVRGKGYKLKA